MHMRDVLQPFAAEGPTTKNILTFDWLLASCHALTRCFLSNKKISRMMASPVLLLIAWIGLDGLHATTEKELASGRDGDGRKVHMLPSTEENE